MVLEKCKRFMDLMDYGYDELYNGKYSGSYKKKVAHDLLPERSKDRLPCDKFRVDAAERTFKNALRNAETFYPTAFDDFASMKQIVSSGKVARAWTFFAARCMFDRIGELLAPGGFIDKVVANGPIKPVQKRIPKTGAEAEAHIAAKAEFEGKVAVFENAASHVHEIGVLVLKLGESCDALCKRSPEARDPQIARMDPKELVRIVKGMESTCAYLWNYFKPSPSGTKTRFSEYMQDVLLPEFAKLRDNETVRSIAEEIRSRKMDYNGPKFERMLRLNALLA
jgi:hypothetical protein